MKQTELARRGRRDRPIRVLFVGVPEFVGSLFDHAFRESPSFQRISEADIPDDDPDFVGVVLVVREDGGAAQSSTDVLDRWPRARVIEAELTSEATTTLYELRPSRTLLGDVGPKETVALLLDTPGYNWDCWGPEA